MITKADQIAAQMAVVRAARESKERMNAAGNMIAARIYAREEKAARAKLKTMEATNGS